LDEEEWKEEWNNRETPTSSRPSVTSRLTITLEARNGHVALHVITEIEKDIIVESCEAGIYIILFNVQATLPRNAVT
jgi:hypothetical protein